MTDRMDPTLNLPERIGAQGSKAMSGPVKIRLLETRARLNLRIGAEKLDQASAVFGLDIPGSIHGCVQDGNHVALCLGPDEWLLYAPEEEKDELIARFSDLYARCPHSLTDISDRQVSVQIKGNEAADLLSIACPRNLRQFGKGYGTRTLFDSVEILLLRHAEDCFELEVWRSFLPHVWSLLAIGNQELASEAQLT